MGKDLEVGKRDFSEVQGLYFSWHMSFVTSCCYSAVRVGRRMGCVDTISQPTGSDKLCLSVKTAYRYFPRCVFEPRQEAGNLKFISEHVLLTTFVS